jgi:GNAT superfamily N-acetyltransferase
MSALMNMMKSEGFESLQMVEFTAAHIEQAAHIVKQNYGGERGFVPALPPVVSVPDLLPFAKNGLGAAAFEGDAMLGFLCSIRPFQNAFGSTGSVGVFSPMGANGAVGDNRAEVYARLYQAAGEKWVRAGASSHAICLYAHDKEAQEQFYRYGFGLRCVDSIRGMDDVTTPHCDGYTFAELTVEEYIKIYPFVELFNRHFLSSPTFMDRPGLTESGFLKGVENDRFFAAWGGGKIIAFISIGQAGETFVCGLPGYMHTNGAYCIPEHRGKGLLQNLLHLAVQTLKAEGYKYLGVDFESVNPAAYRFWLKYFTAYTHSVVRRIDEGAVINR